MRILIDESLPRALKKDLTAHDVRTVQELSWSSLKNGELLKRASTEFDVLLTADQNIRYQQNLKQLAISIVVFPSNRLEVVLALVEPLKAILEGITRPIVIEL